MTIAIGLLATDGLVIATDRQETVGSMKEEKRKISTIFATQTLFGEVQERNLIVAGSGWAHQLDAMRDALFAAVLANEGNSADDLEKEFQDILTEFHSSYISPFAHYPIEDRPTVELLVAMHVPSDPTHVAPRYRMLVSRDNLFRKGSDFEPLGVGRLAVGFLDRYTKAIRDTFGAILLASWLVLQTKESVDGCGKNTDIAGFYRGLSFHLRQQESEALEDALNAYRMSVEPSAFWSLLGIEAAPWRKEVSKERERVRRALKKITERIKAEHATRSAGLQVLRGSKHDPKGQPPSQG